MIVLRLVPPLIAALAALAAPAPAAAQDCPGTGLLLFDGAIYAEEQTSARVETGKPLSFGRLAFLAEDEGCDPRSAQVVELAGVRTDVAVAVEDRPGAIFILGARCAGYEGEARVACALEPLRFEGRVYTGARYPDGAPRSAIQLGEPLGEAELGGETVTAVRIEGVEPAVAVGVERRVGEAFVAAGSCPYERFAAEEPEDDLGRCLHAPLWLVFELARPPTARPGEIVTAHADRVVADAADGASLSLVRLGVAADIVPRDTSGAVPVGTLRVDDQGGVNLPITVPDVPEGAYEAVLRCDRCAEAFGGRTTFPAGSFLVAGARGSNTPRTLGIVLGAAFFVLLGGAVVAWRRGWWRPLGRRRRR